MEDAEPVLVPGYRLDRYELLTPIASGGMASVWLARLRGKRGFEKLFAIKTIKSELTGDSRFQEMFLDEARIASAIQHPNVAQILDLGEQDDILYIVMEWVDGDSLAKIRRLAQKKGTPMPLGLALRVLADACAGLHAAHELRDRQGKQLHVVHRDVSPHNLLVSSAGSVKVIDFGVAKALDRQAGDTSTGVVKGKIRYMAPEQAQGRPLDRRADVWAVGVCLHELVTGELPYDGGSDVDVLRRLMGDEPPPRPSGAIPRAIDELLSRSLVRDPEARYATAAAMQRALNEAIEELGLPAENDDVAAFLRANLLDLTTKRQEGVAKALAASERREGQAPPSASGEAPGSASPASGTGDGAKLASQGSDDAALAPTVMSDAAAARRVSPEAETVAARPSSGASQPSRAKKRPRTTKATRGEDESKVTPVPSAMPEERAAPPRRGLWGAVALVAVAGGAWFLWSSAGGGGNRVVPEPPPGPAPASPPPVTPPSVVAARHGSAPGPAPSASAVPAASTTAAASATPTAAPSATAAASASAAPKAGARDAGKRVKPARPKVPEGTPEEPDDGTTPY